MALLTKNGPMSRADLATATGYSPRHLQRVLPAIEGIQAVKQGRKILYSVMVAAAAATASSSSITMPGPDQGHSPAIVVQHGHEPGQMSIMDISGDVQHGQVGHFQKPIKADCPPNRERVARRHTQTPPGAPTVPGCTDCQGENANKCRSCPLSYAELERDTIQFVIVDQEFRDRLVEEATLKQWRRKTDRGLTWIYQKNITLQVGGDVVVFYSDEPEDLGAITGWVRTHFAGIYGDVGSLVARIKRPHELTREELTVIITDPPTMEEMRTALHQKADKTGTFYLKSPNPNIPGFKAYFYKNTLRCEFDCRDEARKISALYMRRRLLQILPAVAGAPGIFDEWLTDYYNPYEHPIVIDTGIDSMMQRFTDLAETLTDKFTAALHQFVQARPVQATLPAGPDPLTAEIEGLDGFDIEGIVKAFATTLKLERAAVKVYLAAWSAWAGRNFKGRVLKEDIASVLTRANEPQTLAEIADAIGKLQAAGLLQQEARYDVKFSPQGIMLARKLTAKREGVQ